MAGALLLSLASPAATVPIDPVNLPSQWVHGAPDEPLLQVHAAGEGFWVLRQSRRSNFEAPFLYLIAGRERALLLDTGAEPAPGTALPLRETVDRLLAGWARRHGHASLPLVVAHTHAHRDHVFGDAQFEQRPATRVVGTTPEHVAAFFGLPDWPAGQARLDLGGRVLDILPLPGHEPAHIAVYDAATATLFTGDSLYPGLLTIRDWPAYRASVQRLQAFAGAHRIERVLGAHIEMTATARRMYPLGGAYQPEEHALALQARHVAEVAEATALLGDFLHEDVHDDFILGRVIQAPWTDRPSTHGMLVAGTDVVYLSHLPMFHSPHDFQLIFEATLPDAALAAYRADAAAHPDQTYTLAPTRQWVLPATIADGATFEADLYRGHFERGGTPIQRGLGVTVRRVVHFRRFDAAGQAGPRWIAFGRGREHFLAHRLQGAPDMDQVVQVTRAGVEGAELALSGPAALAVGDATPAGPVTRVLYTEYGDLAE